MTSRLDKVIAGGLFTAVAFTALSHGAVEAWSIALFELLILLLMFLWVIKSIYDKRVELTVPMTVYPIAAFLVLGVIQSIAITDSNRNLSSLSFDFESTRYAVKVLFFLFVSHIIAAKFFSTRERQETLIKFLTIFGFALAVFGLIQYFAGNGKLYWIKPASTSSSWVHGPFTNHNHFAGYMELIIPIPIALILTGTVRETRMLFGFAAVLMTIATVATVSRGGIISLTVGLLFVTVAGFNYTRRKKLLNQNYESYDNIPQPLLNWSTIRNLASTLLIIGAIFIGILWVGLDANRLIDNSLMSESEKAETFESSRGWIWRNSFIIFRNNPISGAGLGTFETVFPKYSEGFPADPYGRLYIFDRAHNDYIQILSDTGLIGGIIALWFIITILFTITQSLRSNEPFSAGLAIGCSAAVVSLLTHSIFDFNLQLPSTALLFLILTAILTNLSANMKNHKNSQSPQKNN